MLEQETMGQLTKEQYIRYLALFTKEFGKPEKKKRIKVSFWDPKVDKNLDMQLRITDGFPSVMLKKGHWEGLTTRKMYEYEYHLQPDIENIMNCLESLRVQYGTSPAVIQQYENILWETDGFEIKLSHQFNNRNSNYLFEVELLDDAFSIDNFLEKYDLEDYIIRGDLDFWKQWSDRVNLSEDSLSKDELKALIEKYL